MIQDSIRYASWLSPLSDWDRKIMVDFPHHCTVSPNNFPVHDQIWRWADDQFGRENFTWKKARFFFKREEDRMMFLLRWG